MDHKRNTLKKVAGVSAVVVLMPSTWVKPIVNSMLLPVHAMTSPTALRLDPIEDVFIACGDDRNILPSCSVDDSRVELTSIMSSLSNFINFEMDLVSGQNIDENAIYSIVNNPTESNSELGTLTFALDSSILVWGFGFQNNDPSNDDDVLPIGTFNIILKVENPNGESVTTSVNITFS